MEGNDPEISQEALGTPHTLAVLDPETDEPEAPSAFENNGKVGRPDEGPKSGTQDSARGRDPLGTEIRNREGKLSNNVRRRSNPLKRESNLTIAKNLFNKSKNASILNENSLLDDNI